MSKSTKPPALLVEGTEISLLQNGRETYLSLTDIARRSGDDTLIYNWIRNRNTVEFLGIWEQINNVDFKGLEFERFRTEAGLNNFSLSPKKWIDATGAVGLISKAGRYGGGTFAHRDIALEFCAWLDVRFKLFVIREFQRLNEAEAQQRADNLRWDVHRLLSKVNYRIHSDAVRAHLVPPRLAGTRLESVYFASEADLLNLAVFGQTAKEWQAANPDLRGNVRDHATTEQLLALANLESINAEFIKQGLEASDRLARLNEIAIYQMGLLLGAPALRKLGQGAGEEPPLLG